MTKVVLDANIFVSAVMKPRSTPAWIIEAVRQSRITLVVSKDTLFEIRTVLKYPKVRKFHDLSDREIDSFLNELADLSIVTSGKLRVDAIKDDPSDNIYLACAVEGQADFIVSGDKHLKNLESFRGIPIVSPAEFLKRIKK